MQIMRITEFGTRSSAFLLFLFWLVFAGNAAATGYTLTVGALGSGTVIPDNLNNPHPAGVVITITATPNPGWYFANWSGDTNSSVNPLSVTMNSNLSITGNFLAFPTNTLTLVTNGQGTITLNPAGGRYASNSVVTVTATPATGWVFASWSGSTNGNANPLSITMNTNNSLAGTFAQLPAFDQQPLGMTNVAGSTVSFTSHAVGNALLGYQWFFTGGSLTGATNAALTLTNIQSTNAGKYWIIATNSYGSATSSVVALVITNSIGPTNVVNSPDEAGLRAAIKIGGWVGLGFNGTVTITNTITISNNVILDGENVAAVISGGNAVRLFYVAPGATFCATNLTLANGSSIVTNGTPGTPADAGAIYNNGGMVTLVSCTLTNNNAQSLISGGLARGGAIFNNGGSVSLFQSAISNNASIGGGLNSSVQSPTVVGMGLGGAVYNTNGSVTIAGCNMSSNICLGGWVLYGTGLTMGGAAFQTSGSLTITNSLFASNLALGGNGSGMFSPNGSPSYGGALAATGGSITIDHSQFFWNTAKGGDAGYHGAGGLASGGVVYSAASLTINDSLFIGNQSFAGNNTVVPTAATMGASGYGGAIYNLGAAMLNRCSICSNCIQGGNVIGYSGGAANGGDGLGGGIFNAAQFAATNCTIALNSATAGNGSGSFGQIGATGNAMGGGVFNNTSTTFIAMNLTIASNSCSSPSGVYFTNGIAAGAEIANTNGTLRLHNSLIAYGGTNGNAFGVITDDGFNISSDGSANLIGGASYNYTDPKLGPLNYYTGSTPCMALLPNSPAIDFGDSSGAPATDQRGLHRPNGAGMDMGAYEFYDPNQTVILQMSLTSAANGANFNFTAFPAILYRLQASTNLLSWIDLETNGPFASSTNICNPISTQGWNHRFFRLLLQ